MSLLASVGLAHRLSSPRLSILGISRGDDDDDRTEVHEGRDVCPHARFRAGSVVRKAGGWVVYEDGLEDEDEDEYEYIYQEACAPLAR